MNYAETGRNGQSPACVKGRSALARGQCGAGRLVGTVMNYGENPPSFILGRASMGEEEMGAEVCGGAGQYDSPADSRASLFRDLSFLYGREVTAETSRKERRLPCIRPVGINLTDNPDQPLVLDGTSVDVSARGIGVVVSRSVARGLRFVLRLESRRGNWAIVYRVRHCRATGDGLFRVGSEVLGVIAKPGNDRPEAVIMALLMGSCPDIQGG